MSKYVYKLIPCNKWQIGETESWLSDMAEKGLHLSKLGMFYAKFIKAQPQKIKYRIEIDSKYSSITPDEKNIYEDCGWTYVDGAYYLYTYRKFHIFTSQEKLNAPELHTDPVEQSYLLEDLNKLHRGFIFTILCLCFFTLGSFYFLLGKKDMSTTSLSHLNNLFYMLLIFCLTMICCIKSFISSAVSINKLKKNLQYGKPLNHHAHWKKCLWFKSLYLGTCSILFIFMAYGLLYNGTEKELPSSAAKSPLILLSEIETKGTFTVGLRNTYLDINNFFTPINFTGSEGGTTYLDSNQNYDSSTYFKIYKVRFKSMASNLFYETMEKNSSISSFKKIDNPDFDLLYISEGSIKTDECFQIIACRGNGIIYLSYFGPAPLNEVLSLIDSKLDFLN